MGYAIVCPCGVHPYEMECADATRKDGWTYVLRLLESTHEAQAILIYMVTEHVSEVLLCYTLSPTDSCS